MFKKWTKHSNLNRSHTKNLTKSQNIYSGPQVTCHIYYYSSSTTVAYFESELPVYGEVSFFFFF